MAVLGRSQRRHGPIAASNGHNAANWGLTYLTLSVVLWVAHFMLLALLTRGAPTRDFFPIGIGITIWGAVTLAHVIICVIGLTRASKGRVFSVPSVPFLRA